MRTMVKQTDFNNFQFIYIFYAVPVQKNFKNLKK